MSDIKSQFRTFIKSRSIGEMFRNTTWEMIQCIAFIPVLIFIISPVLQLMINFIFPYDYAFTIDTVSLISCLTGAVAIIMFAGKKIVQKNKLTEVISENNAMFFFLVMIILMIISTCINGFNDYAIHGDSYRNESLLTYIMYFTIYFFCSSLIRSQKLKSTAMYTFIISSILIGVFVIINEFFSPLDLLSQSTTKFSALFGNSNHYGYYLTLTILISGAMFVHEKNNILKSLCLLNFIFNNVILIMNNTFGAYLACFMALILNIIILFIKNRKININAVSVLILFILISLIMTRWYSTIFANIYKMFSEVKNIPTENDNIASGRGSLWKCTIKYISEKPLFGFGVEGIKERLAEETDICDRSHNEFLQYTAFFGIPAGICYLCGVMCVFLRGLKYKLSLDGYSITALVASFGYLVSSFFGNTTYYITPFLFILLGLGLMGNKETINIKEDNINE